MYGNKAYTLYRLLIPMALQYRQLQPICYQLRKQKHCVMINRLNKLTREERELLYQAPVLLSVQVACSSKGVNQTQKKDAIWLSHIKTFTADPVLIPYYQEVEKTFAPQFEATVQEYAPFDEAKQTALKEKIEQVNAVVAKLEPGYAEDLQHSLEKYVNHVQRSAHSVFQDFMFPLKIKGLND